MKKILVKVSRTTTQTLLVLFIATGLVSILALRHNNQQMVKLRDAVYEADKNDGNVNTALNNLRAYVVDHMNSNLSGGSNSIKPSIQLKYTYQRLYEAQLDKVQTSNQKIYNQAKNICRPNNSGYDPARLACIQNYAVTHGVKSANVNVPAGLYEFDFVSPTWSPDLAGWSLLACAALFLALVAKLIAVRRAK
jgi:hypothetical protein